MLDNESAHPRFRRSELFIGLKWLTESSRYEGTKSDIHWLAWTEDGSLFAVDDDGQNFGSPCNSRTCSRWKARRPTTWCDW